uniref:Uncharacterized protein n=1 Tax=Eufriesea mexicana TaxID=516756 RepID=A0A310SC64_9HYME
MEDFINEGERSELIMLCDYVTITVGLIHPVALEKEQNLLLSLIAHEIVNVALGGFNEQLLLTYLEPNKVIEPNKNHVTMLVSAGYDYPPRTKITKCEMSEISTLIKELSRTYLSPSLHYDPELPTLGEFKIGNNHLIVNQGGKGEISYGDATIAIINEIREQRCLKNRFTAACESTLISKTIEVLTEEKVSIGERINFAFMSTSVATDSGPSLVYAAAETPEIGKITKLLQGEKEPKSPLTRQMAFFN